MTKHKISINPIIIEEFYSMIEDCSGRDEDRGHFGLYTALDESSQKHTGQKHWKVSLTLKQVEALRDDATSQADFLESCTIKQIWEDYGDYYISGSSVRTNTKENVKTRGELLARTRRAISFLKKVANQCDAILKENSNGS